MDITILVLAAIVSTVVSATVTFVVSYLIEWYMWWKGSKVHNIQLAFRGNDESTFLKLRYGVNYVRDGRDDIIPNLSEREKWFARLKNEIVYFRGNNHRQAKIRFYRTLGCQFKCFVELDSPDLFDKLKSYLESYGHKEIQRSRSHLVKRYAGKIRVVERVWFLHKDTDSYHTIETAEGIKNNFFYPE
jgi:hypothetical protein